MPEDKSTPPPTQIKHTDHSLLLMAIFQHDAHVDYLDENGKRTAPVGCRLYVYPFLTIRQTNGPAKSFRVRKLDPFGCPVLTDRLRAELRKTVGL